jgi:hypothetical protein
MSFRLCILPIKERLGRTIDGVHFFIDAEISHDVYRIWNGRLRRLGPFLLLKWNHTRCRRSALFNRSVDCIEIDHLNCRGRYVRILLRF